MTPEGGRGGCGWGREPRGVVRPRLPRSPPPGEAARRAPFRAPPAARAVAAAARQTGGGKEAAGPGGGEAGAPPPAFQAAARMDAPGWGRPRRRARAPPPSGPRAGPGARAGTRRPPCEARPVGASSPPPPERRRPRRVKPPSGPGPDPRRIPAASPPARPRRPRWPSPRGGGPLVPTLGSRPPRRPPTSRLGGSGHTLRPCAPEAGRGRGRSGPGKAERALPGTPPGGWLGLSPQASGPSPGRGCGPGGSLGMQMSRLLLLVAGAELRDSATPPPSFPGLLAGEKAAAWHPQSELSSFGQHQQA
ncbi:basic salivary proline-rich protein 4-like [Canis lupus dingo]|uniref:basic salivary proline-rich protein 4-like n=1 Tax=Canis lupus dingo TaxID=286419 RepID=UPI0020C39BC0|nr:basic salivary proline-rich protein 4-like [Canis lupus dingo]